MNNLLASLGKWWEAKNEKQKRTYSMIGVVVGIIFVATLAGVVGEDKPREVKKEIHAETQLMIPNKTRLEMDNVNAELMAIKQKQASADNAINNFRGATVNQFEEIKQTLSQVRTETQQSNAEQIKRIEEQLVKLKQEQQTQPHNPGSTNPVMVGKAVNLGGALPTPKRGANPGSGDVEMPDGSTEGGPPSVPKEEPVSFRVINASNSAAEKGPQQEEKKDSGKSASGQKGNSPAAGQDSKGSQNLASSNASGSTWTPPGSKDEVFIPAGSIIKGVMLNGMDAPTSNVASKQPTPALVRIKQEAILPNLYRMDVRECFALISGHGSLSQERAMLRGEKLTCIRNGGGAIEARFDAYAVGEDGKVGLRGRPVTKQGAIIAKSLLAGFLSGVSKGMAPQAVVNVANPVGGITATSQPDFSTVMENAAMHGVADSLNQVSKFYLDTARELYPVIEIDAGRTVELILVNGISMKVK